MANRKRLVTRVTLTQEQAREIFRLKHDHGCASNHAASIQISRFFRVCPQTIMDIWKGRTWLDATFDLWGQTNRPMQRLIGRPKGRKDSKPRFREKLAKQTNSSGIDRNERFRPFHLFPKTSSKEVNGGQRNLDSVSEFTATFPYIGYTLERKPYSAPFDSFTNVQRQDWALDSLRGSASMTPQLPMLSPLLFSSSVLEGTESSSALPGVDCLLRLAMAAHD